MARIAAESSNKHRQPVNGITMRDPAGIGPEVLLKALAAKPLRAQTRFVIYGVGDVLTFAADSLGIGPFWFRVNAESDRAQRPITEPVVVLDYEAFEETSRPMLTLEPRASKRGGLASKTFVEAAIRDAMLPADDPRHIDALVTAPICKESWKLAGYRYPGHTEKLGHAFKNRRVTMM